MRTALESELAANVRLHTARLEYANQVALSADISKRRLDERKTVLNLAQFSTNNGGIDLGGSELEKLLYALEAEAPAEVVKRMKQDDSYTTAQSKLGWAGNAAAARDDVAQQLTTREREVLVRLQRHIGRVLEWRPPVVSAMHGANGMPHGQFAASAAATAAAGLALTNGFL